jgi:quercetin dioxygenase-like cupin family protein
VAASRWTGRPFEAEAGDVLIISAGAWHSFVATGDGPLRNTAIHENSRIVTEWEDGTRQD